MPGARFSEPPRPRKRPGALALTCLFALLITGNVGMVAEVSGSKEAAAEQRERELDEATRRELLAIGWRPLPGPREPGQQLLASHGVELLHAAAAFELPLAHGAVSGEPPGEPELRRVAALVESELARLPAGFVRRIALRRVVLCRALHEARRPIPSLPNYRGSLLLDVEGSPAFLRRLLHHEVFHFADLADDGSVVDDGRWAALNPEGFRYGAGGRASREPDAGAFTEELPGFVTRYATTGIEEDKAEVFSFMMTAPERVARASAADRWLGAKVARIKELTAELSEDMDASYWARVAASVAP